MANTLKIQKKGTNKFWHYHNNNLLTKFFMSDFDFSLDGQEFVLFTKQGANRYVYLLEDIVIQDMTTGGALLTIVDPDLFIEKLIEISYTPLLQVSGLTLTSDQYDAIVGANAPSASNPFATIADVSGGPGLTPYNATEIYSVPTITVPAGFTGIITNLTDIYATVAFSVVGTTLTITGTQPNTGELLLINGKY